MFERRVGDRFEHPMIHFLRSNVSFGTHFHSVAGDFRERRLHFSSVSPHPSGFISEEMRGVVCEIRDAKWGVREHVFRPELSARI